VRNAVNQTNRRFERYDHGMAQKLGVVSVVDAVVADVRARMLDGSLPAGAPLTEADVAETYDVARTTAKAAIESLVSERLLVRNAHKTARVVVLTADDARDVYRTRALIETQVLRQLAAHRQVPPEAQRAHEELVALAGGSPTDLVAPDMRFHRALVDALGSERTSRAYAALTSEVMLCMSRVQGASLLPSELIVDEHSRILNHITAGDAEAAAAAVSAHLQRAADRLAGLLETGSDPSPSSR
jgi:DNA-binding GntR family transcriptional regulator